MKATVIYDGDCGLCTRVKAAAEELDWFGTMRWIPLDSPEAARFGISREELERSVYFISRRTQAHGWEAVKQILLRLPLAWVAGGAVIRKSPWAALGIAAVLSPAFNPVGDRLYDLVARNRYRFPASTCATPIWDNEGK